MSRRSGLGRGLGAIIPAAGGDGSDVGGLRSIPIDQISPNPHQPRKSFDEETLDGLVESVREIGVLQPVLVREVDGGFVLIAGERRFRAATRAGLTEIPAVVRTVDDLGSLEQALVENLHRQDLNALEEAAAYQQLIEDFGLTQDQVAQRCGRSRSAVANLLRLFQLPPSTQKLVGEGLISAGHAKALLGHPDRAYQDALAKRIVAEGLSVRDVEGLVKERLDLEAALDGGPAHDVESAADASGVVPPLPVAPEPAGRLRPPGVLELEELLANRLDTRVQVATGTKRGRVTIEFANLEDLERISRIILG